MEKFVSCHICMEVYDGDLRCPRVLQCGHSFCSLCIEKLFVACSECPICLMPIANGTLELISINYSLKEIAENCSVKENDVTSNKAMLEEKCGSESQPQTALLPYEGFCELHKIAQRFRCMTCSIWICGDCVAISHKYCKTLLVKKAFKEMKKEHNNEILRHLELTPKSEEDISLFLVNYNEILEKNVKELECYQEKIEGIKLKICEVNQKIEKMINMQTDLKTLQEKFESQLKITSDVSLVKDLDVLKEQLIEHFTSLKELVRNLEVLKRGEVLKNRGTCKSVESCKLKKLQLGDEYANKNLVVNKQIILAARFSQRRVAVFMTINGTTRYGYEIVKNHEIQLHCCTTYLHGSGLLYLTLDQYLLMMNGTKKWPLKIFLQFSFPTTPSKNEVIINLNSETKEASKVVKTYLFGEEGDTFKHMEVVSSRTGLKVGVNLICLVKFLPIPPNVDSNKLLKEVRRKKKWKEGEVALQIWNGINGLEFWLWIFTSESKEELELIPTGQVESGIQECQTVFQNYWKEKYSISSCGLYMGKI